MRISNEMHLEIMKCCAFSQVGLRILCFAFWILNETDIWSIKTFVKKKKEESAWPSKNDLTDTWIEKKYREENKNAFILKFR